MILDDRIFRTAPFTPRIDPPRTVVTVAPAVEPWLAADAEVLSALKLDSSDDAALVTLYLAAARRHFEKLTGLALINQTLKTTWDTTPTGTTLDLPRSPLGSITSATYLDSTGAIATFASASYSAVNAGVANCSGRLALKPDYDWPDLGDYAGAFSATYVAGFGAAATDIPEDIRIALLMLAAWYYEERLPVAVGNITSALPHHLDAIVESHRVSFIA